MKNSEIMESTKRNKNPFWAYFKTKILGLGRAHKFPKQRSKIEKNLTHNF